MALDVAKDTRLLRIGLVLAAVFVLVALAAAAAVALRPAWVREQDRCRSLGLCDSELPGIVEVTTCDGRADRCMTCHVGAELQHARPGVPVPFAEHPSSLAHHPPHVVGCSGCHGGTARALQARVAHALPGMAETDPLMTPPYLQAACHRCHLPGEVPGSEKLARGADLYMRLGCAMCHSLTAAGRGGWDYGPDLRATGRQSLAHIKESVLQPTANFPDSTMPSYRASFADNPEALDDLLIYLVGLALPRAQGCETRQSASSWVSAACTTCHAGQGGRAGGRFVHRCVFIKARAGELRCQGCHPAAIPEPGALGGVCPVVREHRQGCVACHWDDTPW